VLDSTFMAGFLFSAETDPRDVERYFNGLKRAQMGLDFEPERTSTTT
jgi:NitT/TauT family transport system substrate-binding protein